MFQLTELKSCVSGSKLQDLEPAAHFATAGTAATPWPRVQRGAVICNRTSPPLHAAAESHLFAAMASSETQLASFCRVNQTDLRWVDDAAAISAVWKTEAAAKSCSKLARGVCGVCWCR